MGFQKFSLFEHSSAEEETSGGKKKQTKRTPWLVRILIISWLVFFMMGLCSLKTACAQSSNEEKIEKTRSNNIWEKSEVNKKGKQPTNCTVGNNQKPHGKANNQPETEAIQANKTEIKQNWAGRTE